MELTNHQRAEINRARVASELTDARPAATITGTLRVMLLIDRHAAARVAAWERLNDGRTKPGKVANRITANNARRRDEIEALAESIGLRTTWPGLWPYFEDAAGRQVAWK